MNGLSAAVAGWLLRAVVIYLVLAAFQSAREARAGSSGNSISEEKITQARISVAFSVIIFRMEPSKAEGKREASLRCRRCAGRRSLFLKGQSPAPGQKLPVFPVQVSSSPDSLFSVLPVFWQSDHGYATVLLPAKAGGDGYFHVG